MTGMLFYAHSGIRYLVLLSGLIALVWLAQAVAQGTPFDKTSRTVMSIFTGLLDLQILLGLLLLAVIPFYGMLAGHLVMMFAAAFVAHGVVIANRNRSPEAQSNGLLLVGVIGTLALIVAGVMAIGRPIFGSSGIGGAM